MYLGKREREQFRESSHLLVSHYPVLTTASAMPKLEAWNSVWVSQADDRDPHHVPEPSHCALEDTLAGSWECERYWHLSPGPLAWHVPLARYSCPEPLFVGSPGVMAPQHRIPCPAVSPGRGLPPPPLRMDPGFRCRVSTISCSIWASGTSLVVRTARRLGAVHTHTHTRSAASPEPASCTGLQGYFQSRESSTLQVPSCL